MTDQDLVRAVSERLGTPVEFVGRFAGGEVGGTEVRTPDGRRYALKWSAGTAALSGRRTAATLVDRLHERGYPAPRYVLVDSLAGTTVTLQEFAGGTAEERVSDGLVDELVALNELQAAVGDADPGWGRYIVASLQTGCDGYCLHEPLRRYDARTASLLATVQEVGRCANARSFPTGDAVHLDFHHLNVLQRDGRVSAVVDWEGCRSGDRAFDLVTLAFGLSVAETGRGARARAWDAALRTTTAETRRAYVAHMALRQVDWSIRHRTAADVDRWLAIAGEFLARTAS